MEYLDIDDILCGETLLPFSTHWFLGNKVETPLWFALSLQKQSTRKTKLTRHLPRETEEALNADPVCAVLWNGPKSFYRTQCILADMKPDERLQLLLKEAFSKRLTSFLFEAQYLSISGTAPTARPLFSRLDTFERKLFIQTLSKFREVLDWEQNLY